MENMPDLYALFGGSKNDFFSEIGKQRDGFL